MFMKNLNKPNKKYNTPFTKKVICETVNLYKE